MVFIYKRWLLPAVVGGICMFAGAASVAPLSETVLSSTGVRVKATATATFIEGRADVGWAQMVTVDYRKRLGLIMIFR